MNWTRATILGLAVLACTLPVTALAFGASAKSGIGRMTVVPDVLYAGSTGNQVTFTFTADSSSLRGLTLIEFPRGWSAPQRSNPSGPGYIEVKPGQCSASTKITSIGVRRVTIATSCGRHKAYQLVYSKVTAPQLTADGYIFLTSTRSMASGKKTKFRPLLPGKEPADHRGTPFLATIVSTASSGSSVTWSSSRSSGETMPSASGREPIHSRSGPQKPLSKSTTGKCSTLPVWISVSDSNSSSRVPKPPGKMTKPSAAFTNIVLRA